MGSSERTRVLFGEPEHEKPENGRTVVSLLQGTVQLKEKGKIVISIIRNREKSVFRI